MAQEFDEWAMFDEWYELRQFVLEKMEAAELELAGALDDVRVKDAEEYDIMAKCFWSVLQEMDRLDK